MSGLPHHAGDASGISRPQDCAHVLRVFDAVEHNQQHRARRVLDEFVDGVRGHRLQVGRHALVHAAARHLLQHPPIHRFDGNPEFLRPRDDGVHAGPAPRSCTRRETRRAFSASPTV
jgi:hypothetical protein